MGLTLVIYCITVFILATVSIYRSDNYRTAFSVTNEKKETSLDRTERVEPPKKSAENKRKSDALENETNCKMPRLGDRDTA